MFANEGARDWRVAALVTSIRHESEDGSANLEVRCKEAALSHGARKPSPQTKGEKGKGVVKESHVLEKVSSYVHGRII